MQIQRGIGTNLYKGPIDCALQVARAEGFFFGVFRGYVATIWTRIAGSPFYWGVYEVSKQTFRQRNGTTKLTSSQILISGGLAGRL